MSLVEHPVVLPPVVGSDRGSPPRHRVTLWHLVRSEWTKFWTVRTLPLTLAVIAVLILLPGIGLAVVQVTQLDTLDEAARAGFDPAALALSGVPLAMIVGGVLGALAMGGEYASGAIRTTMIAAPRRRALLAAKAVVVVAATAPVTMAATGATYVIAQRIFALQDLDAPVTPGLAVTLAAAAAAVCGAALVGLALVTIVRRTTGAITAFVALVVILPSLVGLVPGAAGRVVPRYLPSTALNSLATTSPATADQETLDSLTRRWAALNPDLARRGGFTVALIGPDGVLGESAAGAAPDGSALQVGDVLRLASLTKTYLAVALLKAQTEGLVDLDEPVSTYVTDVTDVPVADGVTVRMLLQQVSGLPDYAGTPAWRDAVLSDPGRSWTPREVLSLVPDGAAEPGDYAYANTNYVLAGLVLEEVTGQAWTQAVQQLVLDPLELTDTDTTGQGQPVGAATVVDEGGQEIVTEEAAYVAAESLAGPAGAMVADVTDLARFGEALLSGTALTAQEWEQLTAFGPKPGYYGLGLADLGAAAEAAGDAGGIHGLGNNGEIPGYGATLVLYPDRGTIVAVMRNDDRIDALGLAAGVGAGLGVDRDPDTWSTPAAALLLLAHLLVLGGAAAWLIARRDV